MKLNGNILTSYADIEHRIGEITDSKRFQTDALNGENQATREARMVLAARIAVCKYDCKLYGGFVRDWIVGHVVSRPKGITTEMWLKEDVTGLPSLHPEIIPADLDLYLPSHGLYDIVDFINELEKANISVTVYQRHLRDVLLVDKDAASGPFTVDLIKPHVSVTFYDRIDFDVNNLYVKKDYTKHIGMRLDITQAPYYINLETIIGNIRRKTYYLLGVTDNSICGQTVLKRIDKMKNRGWQQLWGFRMPPMLKRQISITHTSLSDICELSEIINQQMISSMGHDSVEILSILEIKNPALEKVYKEAKIIMSQQCLDLNERMLFHGTKRFSIRGIAKYGFYETFYRAGNWGRGAYFTDDPQAEHSHTACDTKGQRVMFYAKVLLGNIKRYATPNYCLQSAPKNFHSLHGNNPKQPNLDEYVVYRYGQLLPYLKITYTSR